MDITNYVWIRFLQKKWLTSYELTGCEVTNHIRILLYHFNPQGDEYEKSIIAFAEDTKINRKGMFAIYRAIARALLLSLNKIENTSETNVMVELD